MDILEPDFLRDHLLRDDLVLHVLLEILEGNTLARSRLFQLFHRFQLHLLAHFVEPFDHLGVGSDTQVLAFFEQQLLVNQVPQNIFVLLGDDLVGVARVLLLRFLFQLLFAAHVLGASYDLIINTGYNLFDDRVRRQSRWQGGKTGQ